MRYELGTRTVYRGRKGCRQRGGDWPDGVWLEPGTILTLTTYHPEERGTGILLYEDEDGPCYDEGWPAWYTAQIVPGATIAIDEDDVIPTT